MGAGLFEKFPDLVKQADDILNYSIQALCEDDPNENLNITEYTQPALYIVNALTLYERMQESNEKINYLAGHSLGE